MTPTDSLIRTKIHPPFPRLERVDRPRLQQQIARGLAGPLTLITAPAGFGKTTLVASCLAAGGTPVAWLSLDKNDNQEGRFLAYLVAALQAADPRIGLEAVQLMDGIQQPSAEAVLTTLINELDALENDLALVLDDYQLIHSAAVHENVIFLIEHLPHTLHLVILTRSDPPLPLARLRARGQIVELRAFDLRFTLAETAQFLNDTMGLHLDENSIALLEKRTEGWIAGLQMAALSMRDRKDIAGFIENFSGSNRYILDYLLEEVLNNQPPEIQHFLLLTSILDRLTAPLCDFLLADIDPLTPLNPKDRQSSSAGNRPDTAPILNYLERENLFLISLDHEGRWFRYHHLFADLLRVRLQQAQPEQLPQLHIRAATWFEQNGFIAEAVQHLLAAREENRAAELIEHYGPLRWAAGDPSLIQLADQLSPPIILNRPKIGLYQAWFLIIQGLIEKALPLLQELAQQLADTPPETRPTWIQTIIMVALAFLRPRSVARETVPLPAYQELEAIPPEESILRDAADILYGMTLGRRGEIDLAAEISTKYLHKASESREIPTLILFLAHLYLMQGRLHAAADLCHRFLDPSRERDLRFIYSTAGLHSALGEALYEWNYLDEAEHQIRESLQTNALWGNIMMDAFGLLDLAHILTAKGNYPEALQTVDKFLERLKAHSRPIEFAEDFRTLKVRVQLASGDLHSAAQWADQIRHSEDFRLHGEYYRLTLARIRLAQERYEEVEALLNETSAKGPADNPIGRRLESNLLLAAAFAGRQRRPEALALIESTLALAEPEGYIRSFVDIGEPARDLLTAYLKSKSAAHRSYAQHLLEAFPPAEKSTVPAPQPAGLIEPLSPRELEVLQLMAQGKTNAEIAGQLIVSPGTIKAHAASIYRKLDAANRTEAVARARQFGLLP